MLSSHLSLLANQWHSIRGACCPRAALIHVLEQHWNHKLPASLSRQLSSKTSPAKNDSQNEGVFTGLLSTVRHFNNGISRLKSDLFISMYIRDAEETRLHLDRKIRQEREVREQNTFVDKEECPKMMNRREQWLSKHLNPATTRKSARHLVQTSKDLRTTMPTVLGFLLIPVFGYAFLALGVLFPKVLLSRQFHTVEQKKDFAMDDYAFRRGWFGSLADNFWGSFMRIPKFVSAGEKSLGASNDDDLIFEDVDASGPVLNDASTMQLYNLCHKLLFLDTTQSSNAFSNIPISHLHSPSLAYNVNSILPLPAALSSGVLQTCFPRKLLESKLRTVAEDTIVDDATLIEEGHLEHGCTNLTGEEIMAACLARGLPVGRFAREASIGVEDQISSMRKLLTNHLKIMYAAMMIRETMSVDGHQLMTGGVGLGSKRDLVRDHALQLLVLHLPAIRYKGKK
jgi:hypothetical protein